MDKQELEKKTSWLGARMREPSTYAGIGLLLAAFHVADATSWAAAITSIGLGLGGLIAIILPENK